MMFKNMLTTLIILIVPATALAGPDWMGITTDWDDIATNWSEDPDGSGWKTEKASFDPDDVAFLGGTEMPIIDDSINTQWGFARVRNDAVITQTGGNHWWMNGTGTSGWGLNMYTGAVLHMTGGKHTADRVAIGGKAEFAGPYDPPVANGVATINIWGTGNFRIRKNPFITDIELFDLWMSPGSLIDIRDDGVFEVPAIMTTMVENYAAGGQIVASEPYHELAYQTIDDILYVSAVSDRIPGDANLDEAVDVSDLGILATNYGTTSGAEWGDADFTADGAVNVSDLGILATWYGHGTAASSQAVPEPSTLCGLLGLFLAGLVASVRRKR